MFIYRKIIIFPVFVCWLVLDYFQYSRISLLFFRKMYMYLILGSRSSDSIFPKWQCTCGVLTYAGTSFCNFLRLYWLVLCFITSISKGWEPFSIRASLAHPLCVSIRVCSHSFSPSLPRRRAHSWASSSSLCFLGEEGAKFGGVH